VFDTLGLAAPIAERDLEQALMDRLQATLLEFGRGMAFVGRQVRLDLGDGYEVVVDLLLFNVEQLRYVVVELKVGRLAPGDVGQLGVYVGVVDDKLRRPDMHHAPTVGLLLVAGRSDPLAQYALATSAAPVAVADWASLPADASGAPTRGPDRRRPGHLHPPRRRHPTRRRHPARRRHCLGR
jgi:hypothetical protein